MPGTCEQRQKKKTVPCAATGATDNVNVMFCAQSSAYFTRSRCEQNQHVPMSAALDAPASWLVRRPGLLRCCSWAAWLAA